MQSVPLSLWSSCSGVSLMSVSPERLAFDSRRGQNNIFPLKNNFREKGICINSSFNVCLGPMESDVRLVVGFLNSDATFTRTGTMLSGGGRWDCMMKSRPADTDLWDTSPPVLPLSSSHPPSLLPPPFLLLSSLPLSSSHPPSPLPLSFLLLSCTVSGNLKPLSSHRGLPLGSLVRAKGLMEQERQGVAVSPDTTTASPYRLSATALHGFHIFLGIGECKVRISWSSCLMNIQELQ